MAKKKAPSGGKKTVKAEPQQVIEENTKQLGMVTGSDQLAPGGFPRTREKVVICGFAPSSMRDAQMFFENQEFEIWGLNQLYIPFPEIVPRATRWFQIHHRHMYDQTVLRDHSHHQWLAAQQTFPIYMQKKEPDVPASVEFPKDDIVAHFGNYFSNSISWMIALAIYESFKEIHVYGVDMATDPEYEFERPSVEFFLGWARGAGIRLVLPEKCDLLKSMWLYPFEDSAPFRAKLQIRRQELRQRANEARMQAEQSKEQHAMFIGALDNMNYIEKTWVNCARELATLENRMTTCKYCGGNHDYRITPCQGVGNVR